MCRVVKKMGEGEGHIQLCFLMVTNGRHSSGWRRAFFIVMLHELEEKLRVYLWQGLLLSSNSAKNTQIVRFVSLETSKGLLGNETHEFST